MFSWGRILTDLTQKKYEKEADMGYISAKDEIKDVSHPPTNSLKDEDITLLL
jgi:hypothetical protein